MVFYSKYKELKKELEKQNHEVIIPLPDKEYDKEKNIKLKAMLDFNKNLEKSEAILVGNYDKNKKEGYIGVNALMEIGMAFNRNKKIFILNKIPENFREELNAIGCIELKGEIKNLN